jgi:hypothetical protein
MTNAEDSRTTDDSEAGLLQDCPNCGYCLRGLQTEQRCPECGQQFDRRWRVFGGMSRWHKLGPWGRAGSLTLDALLVLCIWYTFDVIPYTFDVTSLVNGSMVALQVWAFLNSLRYFFSRPAGFVGVGSDGITIGDFKSERLTRYQWADVQGVSFVCKYGLVLKVKDDEQKFDAWNGDSADARRCVDLIEDYLDGLNQPESGPLPRSASLPHSAGWPIHPA